MYTHSHNGHSRSLSINCTDRRKTIRNLLKVLILEIDHNTLEGMEARLTHVPIEMSVGTVHTLKAALEEIYFNHVTYDFLLILEKTSEDIFWQLFDN